MDKRKNLEEIRAQLGDLKSESKPFDPNEAIKITQVYSSIAAHGSGEYHSYRKQKAREEHRLRTSVAVNIIHITHVHALFLRMYNIHFTGEMDKEWNDAVSRLEMQKRREQREAEEEQEREAKRQKRQRKKANAAEEEKRKKQEAVVGAVSGEFMALEAKRAQLKRLLAESQGVASSTTSNTSEVPKQPLGEQSTDTTDSIDACPAEVVDEVAAKLASAKARLRANLETQVSTSNTAVSTDTVMPKDDVLNE
jgi:hypothetical protein